MNTLSSEEAAVKYLREKDDILKAVIDSVGPLERPGEGDIFTAIVQHIVGQQISSKAQETIWNRFLEYFMKITPQVLYEATENELQGRGISFKKAAYIKDFAEKVHTGEFPLEKIPSMTDEEVIEALVGVKGIGQWTAEMLLIFTLGRPDIISYGDLAIQRGLRMMYHHRKLTPELFRKYKRRYSPYGSVAGLYVWAVAGGAVPGMKDYAPLTETEKKRRRKAQLKSGK